MLRKYRKLLKNDRAVSPVIAVILMVAITVVLAATVYVWVSGFGGGQGAAAKTISLSSHGAISTARDGAGDANSTDQLKNYTVTSATSGMKWSDVTITLDGATLNCDDAWDGTADKFRIASGGLYLSCDDSATGPSSVVSAGQGIEIYDYGGGLSGKTLRVLDSQANSVMYTLTIG